MKKLTGRQEYIPPERCKQVVDFLLKENAIQNERMLGGITDWKIEDDDIYEELRLEAEEMAIWLMDRTFRFAKFRLRTEEGKAQPKSRKLVVSVKDIDDAYTEIQMEKQKQ